MNVVHSTCLSVFVTVMLVANAQAQGEAFTGKIDIQPVVDVSAAMQHLREGFLTQQRWYQGIKTIEYTAQEGISDVDNDSEVSPGSLHFFAKGDKYWYDFTPIHLRGHDEFSFISSYDGEYTRKLEKDNLYMENTKGKPVIGDQNKLGTDGGTLFAHNFLFLPQLFSAFGYNVNAGFIAMPSNLAEAPRWDAFLNRAKLLGQSRILNATCLTLEVPVRMERYTHKPANVRIYLDPSNSGYILGWDIVTADAKPISGYRITKLGYTVIAGIGTKLPFPQEAVIINHVKDGIVVDGFSSVSKVSITSLHLNEEIDDSRFTIEPDAASGIFDTDQRVYINVPR